MSPYGEIAAPKAKGVLKPRAFPTSKADVSLVVFPLRKENIPDDLVALLRDVFNQVVEEGKTYPQEDILTPDGFNAYFLGWSPTLCSIHYTISEIQYKKEMTFSSECFLLHHRMKVYRHCRVEKNQGLWKNVEPDGLGQTAQLVCITLSLTSKLPISRPRTRIPTKIYVVQAGVLT